MINILFSGIDKTKGFTKEQTEKLKEIIKENMTIAFITSTYNEYERNDNRYKGMLEWFKNINISFSNTFLLDSRINKKDTIQILENSDIVFLMGGSPHLQMEYINKYKLINLIKNMNIIMGVSAGSMNQSSEVIYLDEYDNNKLVKYKGLGLVDINMFPHYDINNDASMNEINLVSKYHRLYACPNDTFIAYKNGTKELIGNYYIIENEKYIHLMKLDDDPFEKIKNGTKKIEMRLFDYKRQKINIGDAIEFTKITNNEKLTAEVINIHKCKTFEELYNKFDKILIGYNEEDYADPKDMEKYYSKEEIKKFGVVGIEIRVLNWK